MVLANGSGGQGGETRLARGRERPPFEPGRKAVEIERYGAGYMLQVCLRQPAIARLA